jgi:hypothetical protein
MYQALSHPFFDIASSSAYLTVQIACAPRTAPHLSTFHLLLVQNPAAQPFSMAGNFSHVYGPALGGGVFQVASQFLGQAIINNICKQFPDQKTQRGDAYMDGVRYLLHNNFHLIDPGEQPKIMVAYEV